MSVDREIPPQIASDDDHNPEAEVERVQYFDYDGELYDEELNEHEDQEVLIVQSLATYIPPELPPDGPVIIGGPVPVIYDESIKRITRFVNGQFQYSVVFTVQDVPRAIDYEIRVTAA